MPTSVDIDLQLNPSGDSLRIYMRMNGASFNQTFSNAQFAIKYDSVPGVSGAYLRSGNLGRTRVFCQDAIPWNGNPGNPVPNVTSVYKAFTVIGDNIDDQGCPAFPANTWIQVMRVVVLNNTSTNCRNFQIVGSDPLADPFAASQNFLYYCSLNGVDKTGIVEPTGVQFGNCVVCTPPVITNTTSNSPICSGSTLNLGVTATGTAPLTYTWAGTGTFSPNNTAQNPTVTGAATGNYTITVSNACGSPSTTVPVTVTAAPSATINYVGNPFCSSAGTASVTRTGTAGGTYSASPAGLTLNSSTGAVTLGTSTAGTYTVTYTIAAAGGCAQFTTTTPITVTAAP
ncbi:MAG: hypothetical protein JNM31_07525, partial [Flavobacteriales bacterium]|nr:hypothetical protein [Flavobacteriales bacterium]